MFFDVGISEISGSACRSQFQGAHVLYVLLLVEVRSVLMAEVTFSQLGRPMEHLQLRRLLQHLTSRLLQRLLKRLQTMCPQFRWRPERPHTHAKSCGKAFRLHVCTGRMSKSDGA